MNNISIKILVSICKIETKNFSEFKIFYCRMIEFFIDNYYAP